MDKKTIKAVKLFRENLHKDLVQLTKEEEELRKQMTADRHKRQYEYCKKIFSED